MSPSRKPKRTSSRKTAPAPKAAKRTAKAARRPAKRTAKPAPKPTARPGAKAAAKPAPRAPQRTQAPAPPEGLAYVDGKVVPLTEARIPIHDRGLLLGDGVFETLRVSNGRVFRLADHAERMKRALKAIYLDESLVSEFHQAVESLVKAGTKAFGGELYVRVMVTTGPMEDVLGTGRGLTVVGLCKKFKPYPMQYYSHGVHVIVARPRKQAASPISAVKTLSFLPYITARREAHAVAVHDGLLLNDAGRVAEASTSNVFAVRDGKVYAPGEAEGAIPGVTRAAVLELVRDTGLDVVERLDLATLESADEVWLTNTTGGIVPVTKLNGKPVGGGKKGELTTQLSHALEAAIRGNGHD